MAIQNSRSNMSEFSYISDKILSAEFINDPFPHLEIENFLSEGHLSMVLDDKQIHFEEQVDNINLLQTLLNKKYEIQNFPGCCTDPWDYLCRLENDEWPQDIKGTPIESYGITFRLSSYKNDDIENLIKYLNGAEFKSALEEKFNIQKENSIITAIQKNLTKYEITPHPDTKRKALTYLLNINKDDSVEEYEVHTHLLKFKKEHEHIYKIWDETKNLDRCWVPWYLCDSVKRVRKNNSIVLFAPTSHTLHAIKLDYPHLKFQRTQIYGNLMYDNEPKQPTMDYKTLL
jgi:hypothetical protein